MSFEQLLENLEELKKAQGIDDAGNADGEGEEEANDEDKGKDGDADDGCDVMGKSMTVTMADGTEQEVLDATDMIKSLQDKIGAMTAEHAAEREHLGKSMTLVHDLLKEQGEVLKALGEQVVAMANSGRGRKSTVVTVQGEAMTKSQAATETSEELMNKCLAAQSAGKLSGLDVAIAETSINRGLPIPEHIRTRL